MTAAALLRRNEMQTTQKVVETPAQVELEARLKRVVGVLEDYKAQDVVVIPLAGKTSIADFMVVATGTSSRHVASMGQALEKTLKGDLRGIEGLQEGSWVCADLGDVVAHVFTADKRALYNLEKLWSHVFHSED